MVVESEHREFSLSAGDHIAGTIGALIFLSIGAFLLFASLWLLAFVFLALGFGLVYQVLADSPLSPFYKGIKLVVDTRGIKTREWSLSWSEIQKMWISKGRSGSSIRILKVDQRFWEDEPYSISNISGISISALLEYLQERHKAYCHSELAGGVDR